LAPYGDDITEGIPYTLSNPAGSTNYQATGVPVMIHLIVVSRLSTVSNSMTRPVRLENSHLLAGGSDRSHRFI